MDEELRVGLLSVLEVEVAGGSLRRAVRRGLWLSGSSSLEESSSLTICVSGVKSDLDFLARLWRGEELSQTEAVQLEQVKMVIIRFVVVHPV